MATITPGTLWGEEEMYDSALMAIMKSCGKIQPFLESIFSFLSRRTDFYIIMEHDQAEMGFPAGVALNMVVQAFKKFEILTRKREAELMREAETRRIDLMTDDLSEQPKLDVPSTAVEHLSKLAKLKKGDPMEPISDTNEVLSTPVTKTSDTKKSTSVKNPPPSTEKSPSVKSETTPPVKPADPSPSIKPTIPPAKKPKEETKDGNTNPEKISSDAYNGSKQDNYVWSQTITDLDIRVNVPAGITGRDVKVDIKNDSLKVELLRPEKQVILNGQLLNRIKVEESLWSLDKGANLVHINLEKTKEIMWKSVFEGEEGIDLTKVDTTRDISEFDDEAQAAIQRVTYDHHMKMLGKPTSGQQKAHDILKKAWDAPGSPFKGTPFDPSRVNIAGVW